MIVRILGEGRYDVAEADMAALDHADAVLLDAIERDDEAAFESALAGVIGEVRRSGKRLDHDDMRTSDLVLPHEGSTLSEVKDLLSEA